MRILLLLLLVQITVATEVPRREEADGNGLFVRLELPWTTLLAFESIQFRYILANASDKPLPVAFPSAEHGIRWPMGGQPYLEGMFKAQWKTTYRQQVSTSQSTAFTVLIDGRRFLFFGQSLHRITEVASDDEIEHRIDEHNVNMEITIRGATGSRKLFYDLRNGFTRETPWPINPVILNYPLPEPILSAELARLRATKAEQPAGADQPTSKPADKAPVKVQPSPPTSKDSPR